MSAKLMELVFVLDRSGSMAGKEQDTIGGYNAILKDQKDIAEGDVLVTTVLFDNDIQYLHSRQSIRTIRNLTSKDYYVRGCTALYDAVGSALERIIKAHVNTPKPQRPDRVLFVIATDGYENASQHYSSSMVRQMIQLERDVFHWQFLFLGANIDAGEMAESIGISRNCAADFDTEDGGMRACMNGVQDVIRECRECESPRDLEDVLCDMAPEPVTCAPHRKSRQRDNTEQSPQDWRALFRKR